MAYLPHCKVILSGVLGSSALGGNEIWSTGHQISDTNFADLPSQSQADAIATAWGNFFSSASTIFCDNAYLTKCQVVAINADGTWRKNPDGSFMRRTSVPGSYPAPGAVTVQREYPTSCVVSLMTARAGAHGRGRMYWPLPSDAPDATGYAPQATATARATAARTALVAVNTALATGAYLGVACVASSAGFNSPITAARVGNVHDVQRRRRNGLTEVYSVSAAI